MKHPLMLCIMDGFGLAPAGSGNAISAADTKNLDSLMEKWPVTQLEASGRAVGLPAGQMGNSEVGHMNMGAGRVVWQDLSRISNDIESGEFFKNPAINEAIDHAKNSKGSLHIFGLMSDGGVHSHIDHIKAAAAMAKDRGLCSIYVHCFMDGRDVPPTSGAGYLEDMENYLKELGAGSIGLISGRFYAMDRDKRWERVQAAYEELVQPKNYGESAAAIIQASYEAGETDEFVKPCCCPGFEGIKDGDSIFFANFRPDRAREITRAFTDPDFNGFERSRRVENLTYVCMTTYDATIPGVIIAYPPKDIKNTLGEYVSSLGLTQLRIAETEKYAHVTFFFNGGLEEPYEKEDRILVPSPKVATYDLKPEMSAFEVTDRVIERIEKNCPDLIILNFANCDMVGHTGVFEAAVKAVETVDSCVGRVAEAMEKAGGILLITADHGNADYMKDEDNNVVTAHSTNPVPLVLCDFTGAACGRTLGKGALCDIAPTILELMGLEVPKEMEGRSLLK